MSIDVYAGLFIPARHAIIIKRKGFLMNGANPGMLSNLFPIALVFLIFYFILIRPQQKQQKEFKAMVDALKKNDEVVTIGGVYGTIVNVKDKTFIIRVDDNTRIEIDKSAVARVEKKA